MKQEPLTANSELSYEVLKVRAWQHFVNERLKSRAFPVPVHVGFGYEALAVAVVSTMKEGDQLALPHRNMAYHFASSPKLEPILAEYRAESTGVAQGRLGSMNLAQGNRGLVYTSSILGNNIPVACGLALAHSIRKTRCVVFVVLGDGAMEEGTFYEALVFARSQRLPLVIIVENNNQSMSSTIEERRCPIALELLCKSLDISFQQLAGNDLTLYAKTFMQLRTSVLECSLPTCIEVLLPIFNNHAGPTPGWPTDKKAVSFKDGLLIESDSSDPVFVLKQSLSPEEFCRLELAAILSVPSNL